MGKRYQSVLDMVRNTADKEFAEDLQQQLEDYSVSKQLFVLRNKAGLTQTELAVRVGWPQNRISKIEHTSNDKIRIGDLHAYVAALNFDVTIHITRKGTAVERIKCAAFEIKGQLDHLAQLAQKDAQIRKGVTDFFAEYLFNMLRLFTDSAQQLQRDGRKSKNLFVVFGEMFRGMAAAVQASGKYLPKGAAEEPSMVHVCAIEDEEASEEEEGDPRNAETERQTLVATE